MIKVDCKGVVKGDVDLGEDIFSRDCKVDSRRVSPILTWNFDRNQSLGTVLGVDWGLGKDKSTTVTVKLNEKGVEFVSKLNNNLTFEVGGVVREREENLIKKFDITEVSIIAE